MVARRPAKPEQAREEAQLRADRDRELVRLTQLGDEGAFRSLVEHYRDRCYWISYRIVNDAEDAEDIAQEAFVRAYRSIHRFDLRLRFYSWLYQIVVNLCIDHLRKRGTHGRVGLDTVGDLPGPGDGPSDRVEREEQVERVRRMLQTLPVKYRTIMVLRDIEGFSSKEISDILKTNHATVRWRLHRARGIFKENWELRYGHGSED